MPAVYAPESVRVWEFGDVYVLPKATVFATATHVPTDIEDDLASAWGDSVGLLVGDPGIELPREIEETDLNAWQLKRYRTKWKNGKLNGTMTVLEDNDVVDDLLDPESQPHHVSRYLAMEFLDPDTGWKERRITKTKAGLFVENDSQGEEPKGKPVRIRFYPDTSGKLFTIQKGLPTP